MDHDRGLTALADTHAVAILRNRFTVAPSPHATATVTTDADRRRKALAIEFHRIVCEALGLDTYRDSGGRCEQSIDAILAKLAESARYGLAYGAMAWDTPAAGNWWPRRFVGCHLSQHRRLVWGRRSGLDVLVEIRQAPGPGYAPLPGASVLLKRWGIAGRPPADADPYPEAHGLYARSLDRLAALREVNDRALGVTTDRTGAPTWRVRRELAKALAALADANGGERVDFKAADPLFDKHGPVIEEDAAAVAGASDDGVIRDFDVLTAEPVKVDDGRRTHLLVDEHIDGQMAAAWGLRQVRGSQPGASGGYNGREIDVRDAQVMIYEHTVATLEPINGPAREGGGLVGWLGEANLGPESREVRPGVIPEAQPHPQLAAALAHAIHALEGGSLPVTHRAARALSEAMGMPVPTADEFEAHRAERAMGSERGQRTGGQRDPAARALSAAEAAERAEILESAARLESIAAELRRQADDERPGGPMGVAA